MILLDSLELLANQMRERRAAFASSSEKMQAITAEGTDTEANVRVTSNISGDISEILLDDDWYKRATAEEIALNVMQAISSARQTANERAAEEIKSS